MEWLLVFLEGLLAFVSPCILPMLPIYLVYLAGQEGKQSRTLVLNTVAFILGFTLVFVAMGATASGIGQLLNDYRLWVQRISGVIIILFGLHYIGLLRFRALYQDTRHNMNVNNLTVVSSFLFGFAFSFGWTPCIGPLLGSALMLAASQETIWHGVALLFVFSMGLGVPFLLSALLMNKLKGMFDWIKRHFRMISMISGVLLIIMGVALVLDVFVYWAALFS